MFYFLLLFFVATSYFRILYTVLMRPGFVERGPQFYTNRDARSTSSGAGSNKKRARVDNSEQKGSADLEKGERAIRAFNRPFYGGGMTGSQPSHEAESRGLQRFYDKDVFVCEGDGRPTWCSTCMIYKPDRAHHCREVGRCVRKMDHFCPW